MTTSAAIPTTINVVRAKGKRYFFSTSLGSRIRGLMRIQFHLSKRTTKAGKIKSILSRDKMIPLPAKNPKSENPLRLEAIRIYNENAVVHPVIKMGIPVLSYVL